MRCHICNATIGEMNDLKKMSMKPEHPETFRFGLSTLHANIKFFECILHIAYRLDFKQWKVCTTYMVCLNK